jgi:hypothetical protein
MAVQKELWQPLIIEALFKANPFLNMAKNADDYVLNGKIVHIPQSGGPADVERNRSVTPAVAVKRTDTDITYPLDEYTTDPVHIPHADTVELSYDKRASVVRENTAQLVEVVADNCIYNWAANAIANSKLPTTGTDDGAGKKKLIEADILAAQFYLNKLNIPKQGRYMMLTSEMIRDLMTDNNLKYAFQQVVNLPDGVIGRLYGFDILERSSVLRVTSGDVPKLPEAADAGGDKSCGLFWQRDMVERAMGDVTMFDDYANPLYYGDLYSFLMRFGGRTVRGDHHGVGLLMKVAA